MKTILRSITQFALFVAGVIISCAASAAYVFVTIDYPATPPSTSTNNGFWGTSLSGNLMILQAVVDGNNASFIYDTAAHSFTRLPPPPAPWISASAIGINDFGTVVGSVTDTSSNQTAFIFDHGIYTFFSRPEWIGSEFRSINNSGIITGWNFIRADGLLPVSVGVIFDPSAGTYTEISVPGASPYATIFPHGINSAGQAVGTAKPYNLQCHSGTIGANSFLREPDGTLFLFTVADGFRC